MAPLFSQDRIKECLAMGADEAYIISDAAFGGADTFSTSYTLSKGLQKTGISFDLILAGNESADGATSHVPAQLGEWMGLPHVSNVLAIVTDGKTAAVKRSSRAAIWNTTSNCLQSSGSQGAPTYREWSALWESSRPE